MKVKTPNAYRQEVNLSWVDLDYLKDLVKCILETNIALKEWELRHVNGNDMYKDMTTFSIDNSRKGLIRIDNIRNVQSISNILQDIGQKDWETFIKILSYFSGTCCDDKFYEFDESISIINAFYKEEEGGE